METLTVRKWGNSLAIRIPKSVADENGLYDGSRIRYSKIRSRMVFELDEEKLTLKDLLERITPENLHPATDWGKPVGNEVW
jgi:antitoxin MazE